MVTPNIPCVTFLELLRYQMTFSSYRGDLATPSNCKPVPFERAVVVRVSLPNPCFISQFEVRSPCIILTGRLPTVGFTCNVLVY